MNSDLTFITNEENRTLLERFRILINDTRFFDVLVGYFYTCGFHALYKSLEKTEKIRILTGISTNRQTYDLLQRSRKSNQQTIEFSHAETKQAVESMVENELADSEDNRKVEEGVNKFIEWVNTDCNEPHRSEDLKNNGNGKKLQIKAYPSQNIHAKLYIMTFHEGDRDVGRVITGSSNFTQAGLIDNLEFNVELKNRSDYDFAGQKFDELWNNALCYTGDSGEATRDKVIENFDARARHPKEDYRILIATEVLTEGVNLHRSNTVINYDIPWNPTRMMQRVGRVNRVDTLFETIHTFNFFPTKQSNDQIKLKEAAEAKINAFLTLLGGDAELLTEGEPIGSHELFNRLISKQTLEGEEGAGESELKYLHVIKEIRDKAPALFETIKRLPKKARTAKQYCKTLTGLRTLSGLITYFRRGKLQKFFNAEHKSGAEEMDFLTAAKLLESSPDEMKEKLPEQFYDLLDKNKEAFVLATTEEIPQQRHRGGRDSAAISLKF